MSKIYLTVTIKTPERYQWHHFGVFIFNFEQLSFWCSGASIVDFEQVNSSLVIREYYNQLKLLIQKQSSPVTHLVGKSFEVLTF